MNGLPAIPPSPGLLCAGPLEETTHFTIKYLQQLFCPHRAATCRCSSCVAIAHHQSSSVTWLAPEADYVLEDIEPILRTARYRLEAGGHHAFVLPRAESLSPACANRLLKIIEEPPAGYLFFFLTTDVHALLPTIQSRCIVLFQSDSTSIPTEGLLSFFTQEERRNDAVAFDTFLRNESISVAQAKQVVHQLAATAHQQRTGQEAAVASVLEKAQRNFPQPGGVALYVRWLFMALAMAREQE